MAHIRYILGRNALFETNKLNCSTTHLEIMKSIGDGVGHGVCQQPMAAAPTC